jgi:F-type H+-transporting ATPase subunit epsilon
MDLQVLLPTSVLVEEPVIKVIAEAENGYFCLEPRHIDFVAALVPGVLIFTTIDGRENFVAVDQGVLVKCGQAVWVSTLNGVRGDNLGDLEPLVQERFLELDEAERRARSALARLEAGALRGIRELQEGVHG